jgi:hypothetical protein
MPLKKKIVGVAFTTSRFSFPWDNFRCLRIVTVSNDAAVEEHPNCFLNDRKRQQEPFARSEWLAETILDFNIEPRLRKEAVHQIFEFIGVHVDCVIGPHRMDGGEQESLIVLSVPDPILKPTRRKAYLEKMRAISGIDERLFTT